MIFSYKKQLKNFLNINLSQRMFYCYQQTDFVTKKKKVSKKSKEKNSALEIESKIKMEEGKIYHEKQKMLFCAKHALNNLYQAKKFTSKDLDDICDQLTKTKYLIYNPHRNIFKLGNYDINVIDKALQNNGHTIQWFDMRKDVKELNLLEQKNDIFGLILNVQYKNTFDKIIGCNTHHWLTIKVINNEIYNLDSKQNAAQIMSNDDLYDFLLEVKKNNGQILIVRKVDYDQQINQDINENKNEIIQGKEELSNDIAKNN
ncbi:josephin protein (macronuclear) [Tetrahymena thermophila SB210]|uniref:ubiquitinyl hydrolase 1 n=1 Tax=Tetrahymena thermophila (strain SB210) TaxID=312017 RepID=I7M5W6_TETTS|nr:josephin protein [Tetrahymena thermophila SB210]EAR83712.2 josephin protein [Tetrahymena thermophila SB210]|eukprot:XP_001031375.2 josephin protein [Tetrahymena thermophila SB210]